MLYHLPFRRLARRLQGLQSSTHARLFFIGVLLGVATLSLMSEPRAGEPEPELAAVEVEASRPVNR